MIEPYLLTDYQQIEEGPHSATYQWADASMFWPEKAAAIYADGGVLRPRGCEAGSWAWVAADGYGNLLTYQFGWVEANPQIDMITNNLTEYLAVLRGLEALPDLWTGKVCSDSGITLGRFSQGWKTNGIPRGWLLRAEYALRRLAVAPSDFILHKGHPTREDLARGHGVRKSSGRSYPVSIHQELCDKLCGLGVRLWQARQQEGRA